MAETNHSSDQRRPSLFSPYKMGKSNLPHCFLLTEGTMISPTAAGEMASGNLITHGQNTGLNNGNVPLTGSESNKGSENENIPLTGNGSRSTLTITTVSPCVTPIPIGHGERPEMFNGRDFKMWQHKMLFYLTTQNLARFLTEDAPELGDNPNTQTVAAIDAWKHADFLCKNYILNGLDNSLYNMYSPIATAKALWESLDKKYKTEDAGTKNFVVARFLDFKMVDSKTIMSQVQEYELILRKIHALGMNLSESFQVAALIEKLPYGWMDFKNYLKHKRKEMTLEDLILRLRIEENIRYSEKRVGLPSLESQTNVIEHSPSNKKRKFTSQGQKEIEKKKQFNRFIGNCYVCDKLGHKAKDCKLRNNQGNPKK